MAAAREESSDEDPIRRLLGSPDPSLGYVAGTGRRWVGGVWPVVVIGLVLYFIFGP